MAISIEAKSVEEMSLGLFLLSVSETDLFTNNVAKTIFKINVLKGTDSSTNPKNEPTQTEIKQTEIIQVFKEPEITVIDGKLVYPW